MCRDCLNIRLLRLWQLFLQQKSRFLFYVQEMGWTKFILQSQDFRIKGMKNLLKKKTNQTIKTQNFVVYLQAIYEFEP